MKIPDFLIIGASRSGTTSLYNYLNKHPSVSKASRKEIHFFDIHFHKGIRWYKSQFSLKKDTITGEASPYYIFHPHAPRLISNFLPNVKLIALLRNPIDRAYSHYWLEKKILLNEYLSFEKAIRIEYRRLKKDIDLLLYSRKHSFNHQQYSYLSRGIYIDQLKRWYKFFPRNQILVIKSEDFYEQTQSTMDTVFKFLNISNFELNETKQFFHINYPPINPITRQILKDYFEPHNQKLYTYLKRNFNWE